MSQVAFAEKASTSVCEIWDFLLLRNATKPAAAPQPSSSSVSLSSLEGAHIFVQTVPVPNSSDF